jgi:hypothetical protein
VATSGAAALRLLVGDLLPALFVVELLLVCLGRDPARRHTLALAGAALGQYLGPIVFLRGDAVTHYLFVVLPLLLLVAARGLAGCGALALAALRRWRPAHGERGRYLARFSLALVLAPLVCLCVPYYQGALDKLRASAAEAAVAQTQLDRLGLDGRRVACRRMTWFVDRDVQTVLLPNATVPELERYAAAHRLDGILIWHHEPSPFFAASRYPTPEAFERAMRASPRFGAPQVSGEWQWFPVRRPATSAQPQALVRSGAPRNAENRPGR